MKTRRSSRKAAGTDIQDGIRYHGNPDQIKQLVGIFMDNALKYSEEHGQIRVTLQQTQNKKVLKVYNTGKGIPESEKEKIFQRFYRSDASRSRATRRLRSGAVHRPEHRRRP